MDDNYNFDVSDYVARLDFCIRNNADWRQPFKANHYDPNSFASTPYDLTGATLRMQWRDPTTQVVIFELSTVNGRIVVTDLVNGAFVTAVVAADLFVLTPGFYESDMIIINADTSVDTAFIANITLTQGDTQPTIPPV